MILRVDEVMTRTPKTIGSGEMAVDAMQVGSGLMLWLGGWVHVLQAPAQGACPPQVVLAQQVERRLSSNHALVHPQMPCQPSRTPPPPPPLLLQAMEAGPKVAMLPVVDDGRVQGLVTLHALVSAGL